MLTKNKLERALEIERVIAELEKKKKMYFLDESNSI